MDDSKVVLANVIKAWEAPFIEVGTPTKGTVPTTLRASATATRRWRRGTCVGKRTVLYFSLRFAVGRYPDIGEDQWLPKFTTLR